MYEFFITFDQEIITVWSRGWKLSFGSLLLVSTRWSLILSAITGFIQPLNATNLVWSLLQLSVRIWADSVVL